MLLPHLSHQNSCKKTLKQNPKSAIVSNALILSLALFQRHVIFTAQPNNNVISGTCFCMFLSAGAVTYNFCLLFSQLTQGSQQQQDLFFQL
jgi:hypothetical protein